MATKVKRSFAEIDREVAEAEERLSALKRERAQAKRAEQAAARKRLEKAGARLGVRLCAKAKIDPESADVVECYPEAGLDELAALLAAEVARLSAAPEPADPEPQDPGFGGGFQAPPQASGGWDDGEGPAW